MSVCRPNLVVILSDQHNPHVMGCAGDPVIQTPNLDRLAAEGVHFMHAYCPHPLCVPSRAGFLTGRHPGDVNVWSNHSSLASDIPTFAHALGAAGYETVLCGRMHFYDPDQFHGFERRLVGDCWGYLAPEIRGFGANRTNGQTRYAVEVSGHGRTGYEVFDEQVTDAAIDVLGCRTPDDRPCCIVVGYILPHNPFICSRELFEQYLDALPVPPPLTEEVLSRMNPALRKWILRRGVDRLTPEQNHRARAAYYGLVTTMDHNIGRIVDAVRTSADAENTAIVYCSDHGDMAGEHGMWWKSNFYDASVGVPLMASWPGRFAADVKARPVTNLIDLAPTLLELAGATGGLPDAAGRSLVPILETGRSPEEWKNETFAEFAGAHGDAPSAMLLAWPWKLMYYAEFESCLLFNLEEDPGECRDRANDAACAALRDDLLVRLKRRWSPERMAAATARERRNRKIILSCGHPLTPHADPEPRVPDGANAFDFAQLPNLAHIRARCERGEK